MILWHMHHPAAPSFVHSCNNCMTTISTGYRWSCADMDCIINGDTASSAAAALVANFTSSPELGVGYVANPPPPKGSRARPAAALTNGSASSSTATGAGAGAGASAARSAGAAGGAGAADASSSSTTSVSSAADASAASDSAAAAAGADSKPPHNLGAGPCDEFDLCEHCYGEVGSQHPHRLFKFAVCGPNAELVRRRCRPVLLSHCRCGLTPAGYFALCPSRLAVLAGFHVALVVLILHCACGFPRRCIITPHLASHPCDLVVLIAPFFFVAYCSLDCLLLSAVDL